MGTLSSHKYLEGAIIVLDPENIPVERIIFKHPACTDSKINCVQSNDEYATTSLIIQVKELTVGNKVDFLNEWNY